MTQAGCLAKAEWPMKNLTGWGTTNNALNGRTICVQRKPTIDFISQATNLTSAGACATGMIECGSTAATDPERLKAMCVPASLGGCPVMNIMSSGSTPIQGGAVSQGSVNIVWSKEPSATGDLPISELVISVSDVCKNNNNNAKEATNLNNYILRRTGTKNQVSCEGGIDSSFIPFASTRYVDFLTMNTAFPTTDPKLANSYSSTEEIKLFKRVYFPLKKTCRSKASEMEKNDSKVDQMRGAQTGLLIVSIIVAIVIGFIIAIMDACMLLHSSKMCVMKEKNVECIKKVKGKQECLSLSLKIINACFLLWAVIVSAGSKNFFKDLSLSNCFTVDINILLASFSAQVETFVYKKNLNALISFCVAMALSLLKLAYNCLKKKKPKDANAQGSTPQQNNEEMKPGQIVPINNPPSGQEHGKPPPPNFGANGQMPTPPASQHSQMQPMTMQPVMMQPVMMQPVMMQPVMMQQQQQPMMM